MLLPTSILVVDLLELFVPVFVSKISPLAGVLLEEVDFCGGDYKNAEVGLQLLVLFMAECLTVESVLDIIFQTVQRWICVQKSGHASSLLRSAGNLECLFISHPIGVYDIV